jgi:hypothetical protein
VVKALCYKSEGRGFETLRGDFLFNLPIRSGRTRVYSASYINEYQKQKNNGF